MIQQQIADASSLPQERVREILATSSRSSCAERIKQRQEVQSALAQRAGQELLEEERASASSGVPRPSPKGEEG